MKTNKPNDRARITIADDAIRFAEYMLPSWRVVMLIFAGMFLAMPLFWSNIVTWSIGGVPAAWLTFIALRRRIVTIDLRRKQVAVGQGLVVPFHESRYDLARFTKLRTDTNRVYKRQENGTAAHQTVTKKFILDGTKPCLLCRRGYGGKDKETEGTLRDVERHLKLVLEPHFKQDT